MNVDLTNAKWIVFPVLLLYWGIAFTPFDWQFGVKQQYDNGARWTRDNEIHFHDPGIAVTTEAPRWLALVAKTSTLRISLEFLTTQEQFGPARILTISADPLHRNLTIGQEGLDLVVRLRSTDTTLNGFPDHVLEDAVRLSNWHKVELEIGPGSASIRLDGKNVKHIDMSSTSLVGWSPHYKLALGNELTGNRHWLGRIRHATITTSEEHVNYVSQDQLTIPLQIEIPDQYLQEPIVEMTPWFFESPKPLRVKDWFVNLTGFIPLGIILSCIGGTRRTLLPIIILCACVSISLELGQLFLPSRVTSIDDVILNTLGGAIGAWTFNHFYK